MANPLVSIIVPFYNSNKFLQETINSVFSQTYQNWELILVDDGSIDGSEVIAQEYTRKYPDKVHCLHHEGHKNKGVSPSRNLGLNYSKGEYIASLDSDDIWMPKKLESHISILDKNPDADALFGATLYWYNWTKNPEDQNKDFIWEPWKSYGIQLDAIIHPPKLLYQLIKNGVMPCIVSLVMRRELIFGIGKWVEEIPNMHEDQALYVKLFLNAKVFITYGWQEKYRQHEDSLCFVADKEGKTQSSRIIFLQWVNKYLSEEGYEDEQIKEYLGDELKTYRNTTDHIQKNIPLPVGLKDFGDLHRVSPLSRVWGFDRGTSLSEKGQPVDRVYIESFLQQHSADIKGRVLEIGEPTYTRKFGGETVVSAEVLDVDTENNNATLIFDLAAGGEGFPQGEFDCFILTQTLLLIYDVQAAVQNAFTLLKPEGVLLVTLPGISQICQPEMEQWGDYWRFTSASALRLFGDVFGKENVTVETFGNVMTATAFLYGLAASELENSAFEYNDPDYQVTITVRAVKKEGFILAGNDQTIEMNSLHARLAEIEGSQAWKLALWMRRLRHSLIPSSSRYGKFFRKIIKGFSRIFGISVSNSISREDLQLVKDSCLFNTGWYLENNPDIAQAGVDPVLHYLQYGGFEGRDPSPGFSSSRYLERNPDVKSAGFNPLLHYLMYGRDEGRSV